MATVSRAMNLLQPIDLGTAAARRGARGAALAMALAAAVAGWGCRAGASSESAGAVSVPAVEDGFHVVVFAEGVGRARHIAVRSNGDVYVHLSRRSRGGGVVALRDTDGDGAADRIETFGEHTGTGIHIEGNELWVGADDRVLLYRLEEGELVPREPPVTIVSGFPRQRQHAAKSLVVDAEGNLYVNVGAPSNACQQRSRTPGSPGMRPCPQLALQAGIWRYDARRPGQRHGRDGERFATGLRNCVALDWDPRTKSLYAVPHGRDQLDSLWPEHFSAEQNAELPAEEFHRIEKGGDYGWPYTYWDPVRAARMLAPEYGGDGRTQAPAGRYRDPLVAFPAHWAPNDLLFYRGSQFPRRYRGGAFVAFHGSWNRAPLPQKGFLVAFVPMKAGRPAGPFEVFARGFAGREEVASPAQARYRPMGLAEGPDGALYVADSREGRIWKITWSE